jgi:signal transduction histidine kinase/CheY-like chemotaxis protein
MSESTASTPTSPKLDDLDDARVRDVLDGLPDGVVAVAGDGSIRFANRAAAALLGRTSADLVGTRFPLPLAPASEVPLPARSSAPVRPSAPPTIVSLRVAEAMAGGESLHLVTLRDVTSERRLDRLRREVLRANRRAAMVEVTRTIAHEIRNPAAFILANLAVMRDMFVEFEALFEEVRLSRAVLDKYRVRPTLDELREMVEDNVLGIDRMRSFLEEFRSMTQEQRRRHELVDLADVAATACELWTPWLPAPIEIVRELVPVPAVVGDRVGLILVVESLLANAVDALAGAARPRITVRTEGDETGVRVVVIDTGCGVPAEQLDKIFDPLFLPDPQEGALGVGLAVASDIASTHGGRIEVESAPGQGSRFTVILPRDTGLQLDDHGTAGPGEVRGRVLIVDDDRVMVRSLRRVLEAQNDVTSADGGASALELLARDQDYDVVLCALSMAAMDGPELHAALRKRAPELASRMVFIGSSDASPRVRRFVESERVLVLEKPVEPELLLEVVERMSR